ncbi:phosphatase PAP2 family protein [Actinomycetaceae bacterium WB03_NA08]|uniref:Phosphatase PAP2 family protein n=1 Tax=Scrofimicrobium canadense TaxID=2652290 RepID=A0A6N7W3Z7_9ACTO|nr:phosphatase PAP2 family protein [Scrofimicrobium canadense]MSS83233.1 phosphatase PAP2 family protein [Scrofimicrobium canadense]
MNRVQQSLWVGAIVVIFLAVPAYLLRDVLYHAVAFTTATQETWWAAVIYPIGKYGYLLIAVLGAVTLAATWRAYGWKAETALIVSPFVAWGLNWLFKSLVREERPCAVYQFPSMVPCPSTPPDWSWPSGHSAIAAALATSVLLLLPRLWPLAAALAFLQGYGRVALGAHYVHDVLSGWAVGIIGTLLTFYLFSVFFGFSWWRYGVRSPEGPPEQTPQRPKRPHRLED